MQKHKNVFVTIIWKFVADATKWYQTNCNL